MTDRGADRVSSNRSDDLAHFHGSHRDAFGRAFLGRLSDVQR
jgi:hypothetical protein